MYRVLTYPDAMPVHFRVSFLNGIKDRPCSNQADELSFSQPFKMLESMYDSTKSGEIG